MNKVTLIFSLLFVCNFLNAQNVNIPDANLKKALLAYTPSIDKNNDGEIQISEARAIKGLDISNKNIDSIAGIEAFINLVSLDFSDNNVKTVNLSKNTKLTSLTCVRNKLINLDISKNTELDWVLCFENEISSINLSKNLKLRVLNISQNKLATINVSKNIKLVSLDCSFNDSISTVNISNNNLLEYLDIANLSVNTIDFSNTPLIKSLSCFQTKIKEINLKPLANLETLKISTTDITTLDLSQNTKLTDFQGQQLRKLEKLDVSKNVLLESFLFTYAKVTELDLSFNKKLTAINAYGLDGLSSINIKNGNNTKLTQVQLYSNPNLRCIQVDDVAYAKSNKKWGKDSTANYNTNCSLVSYLLVNDTKNGTVSKSPKSANGEYKKGASVLLTATPSKGYQFNGWKGDATGNTNPLTLVMNTNKTISASFIKIQRKFTSNAINGWIAVDTPINYGGFFDNGQSITVTAYPNDGYEFVKWEGDLTGTTNPATIVMDKDKNITAVFKKVKYTLTTTANNGKVDASPKSENGSYPSGQRVILTANPSVGYEFDSWQGDATGTDNPFTIVMDGNKRVTAKFRKAQRLLTVKVANGSYTTNPYSSNNKFKDGTNVTITISPNEGYKFDGWEGDATGKDNPLVIKMNADKNITARIVKKQSVKISVFATGFDKSLEGIGINSKNEVYVSEHNTGKIFKVNAQGNKTLFASTKFRANDLAFNNNDELFIAEPFNGEILKSDNTGTLTKYIKTFPNSAYGVAFKNNLLYYVTETNSKVVKVNANKTTTDVVTNFFTAEGIAFDSKGNMYVTDRNDRKLFKITPSGEKLTVASGYAAIRGVAVANDVVYFTTYSYRNNKVVKFDPDSNNISDYVTTNLNKPRNLEIDKLGNMYVTNGGDGTITKIFDKNLRPKETASINNRVFNNTVILYPNPVKNNLSILLKNSKIKNIHIYNILGKKVLSTKKTNINTKNLLSGIYLLKIVGENNKIVVKKFIKK